MNKQQRRLASVYIGVVGSELENGICTDSIRNLTIRVGDSPPRFIRATKGYEARQAHLDYFEHETNHGAILMLDSDMVFAPDSLERLRSHGIPYITGYYMRRMYQPIIPVMFDSNPAGSWPFEPMTRDPARGKLHPVGASGRGCILLHREVLTAAKTLLRGEQYVLEDDMDIWPYDPIKVIKAVRQLKKLKEADTSFLNYPKARLLVDFLFKELRPLRMQNDVVGSDIRFPYLAHAAGYQLMLDPDVRPSHHINYMLSPEDYTNVNKNNMQQKTVDEVRSGITKAREHYRKRLEKVS